MSYFRIAFSNKAISLLLHKHSVVINMRMVQNIASDQKKEKHKLERVGWISANQSGWQWTDASISNGYTWVQ